MKYILHAAVLTAALAAAGCSGSQVKRDVEHAEAVQRYLSVLNGATAIDSTQACRDLSVAGAVDRWTTLEFSRKTPIIELPNGVKAAAVCISVPAGVRAMEVKSPSSSGLTYYEITVVHPSVLLFDERSLLISDVQKPRMSPGESFFSGFELNGVVVLLGERAATSHVVVYIHPQILDGYVDVHTGYETIPVPYAPHGTVKIRFRS